MTIYKKAAVVSGLLVIWGAVLLFTQFRLTGIIMQYFLMSLVPGNGFTAAMIFCVVCLIAAYLLFTLHRRAMGLVLLLIGGLLPLNVALWSVRDHRREVRMRQLQGELEVLRRNMNLPENLRGESLQHLATGPFGIDRIRYHRYGTDYTIESYGVPLGPFTVYSSDRGDWYYEE